MPDDRPLSKDLPVGTKLHNRGGGHVRTITSRCRDANGFGGWNVTDSPALIVSDTTFDRPTSPWSILPSDEPPEACCYTLTGIPCVLPKGHRGNCECGKCGPAFPSDEEAEPSADDDFNPAPLMPRTQFDLDALREAWEAFIPGRHNPLLLPNSSVIHCTGCDIEAEREVVYKHCQFQEFARLRFHRLATEQFDGLLAHVSRLEAVVEAARRYHGRRGEFMEDPLNPGCVGFTLIADGALCACRTPVEHCEIHRALATLDTSVVVPDADGGR